MQHHPIVEFLCGMPMSVRLSAFILIVAFGIFLFSNTAMAVATTILSIVVAAFIRIFFYILERL